MNSLEDIISSWKKFDWEEKLSNVLNKKVKLLEERIECLKNTREKTSIWKLILSDGQDFLPVVLKIYKLPLKENHRLEINMYQKAYHIYHEFMPKLYWLEPKVNGNETWMFTECMQPLRGQIKLTPSHLERIIPTVAKFHALTYDERFLQYADLFDSTLPHFDSKEKVKERTKGIKKAKENLDLAMIDPNLKELVAPRYKIIKKILKKGPVFFPEMEESGQCLVHGDLHVHNICCENANDEKGDWKVSLIDWESAKHYPCWYDLVVLVELLIDFRSDWQQSEDEIRNQCVKVYSQEMLKYGITFNEEPLNLLKKAYLQRTLEKKLSSHLEKVLNGGKSTLLKRYLEKIEVWGKELGLY
ncbi:phosphotransferase [Neobacillus drentensis]|uniref:phosphotransferase n=1 Tax=Neobacillus drentensis TaxID=220684 RepID=UPI003001ADD1